MDEKIIFSILGIPATKEENLIKTAYRNQLVKVNPEENQEGFKALRRAYEEALLYARQKEREEKKIETAVELWMERVKQVYECFPKRIDKKNWEVLMKEEVCQNLETSLEARNSLLLYLSEHFRLRTSVWKLINRIFFIEEEAEELYKKFPPEFIQFILQQCEKENDFSYDLFEGAEDADYDAAIYQYAQLIRSNNDRNWEESKRIIEIIENINLYHPMIETEKARYYLGIKQKEQAISSIYSVLEKYRENLEVLPSCAEVLWDAGEEKEAVSYFKKLIELYPKYYIGNRNLGHYYYKKKEYEKAKEYCYKALKTGYTDNQLQKDIKKANDKIIEEYENNAENMDMKQHLKIGWCYLQNEYASRGLYVLQDKVPSKEEEAEYHSLMARLYLMTKEWDKSLEHAKLWFCAIQEETNEIGGKEEISKRLSKALDMMTKAYMGKAEEEPQFYIIALEKIEQAIHYNPDEMEFYLREADIYINQKQYEKVIQTCDKMRILQEDYFFIYVYYQKAYYELRMANEVIENFYKAKQIYPYYPEIYELPIQVYYDCSQYKEAQEILSMAKKENINSHKLILLEIKVKLQTIHRKKEIKKLYRKACKEKEKFKRENAKTEDLAELTYLIACCLRKTGDFKQALANLNQALKLHYNTQYTWIKGNIYLELKEYENALEAYMPCYEEWKDSYAVLERIAYCHQYKRHGDNTIKDYKQAYFFYRQVLELYPEHEWAADDLMNICKTLYLWTYEKKWYKEAVTYADYELKQKGESVYIYNERGRLHLEAGEWNLAIKDFEAAARQDKKDIFPYINQGCVYIYTKQYQKAIVQLEEAAKLMKEVKSAKVYGNMADCYERMGKKEKAISCYEKNIRLFKEKEDIGRTDIFRIYVDAKEYKKAEQFIEEAYAKGTAMYYNEKGDVYLYTKQYEKARYYYQKALEAEEDNTEAYFSIGLCYLCEKKELKKAYEFFRKELEAELKKEEDIRDGYLNLMRICYIMRKKEEGRKYFNLYMKKQKRQYGSHEIYLRGQYKLSRFYNYGCAYVYIGEIEKAKEYLKQMEDKEPCIHCIYPCCYEYFSLKGLIEEALGNKQKAKENYRKVFEIVPNFMFNRFLLENLGEDILL